jgi:hypothetical protein
MTLIETMYHIVIPIVTHHVTKDLRLPKLNVIRNLSELITCKEYPIKELNEYFQKFYDE